MSYPIGIYEHSAHLFAGLPGRVARFEELDRLIAEEKRQRSRSPETRPRDKTAYLARWERWRKEHGRTEPAGHVAGWRKQRAKGTEA